MTKSCKVFILLGAVTAWAAGIVTAQARQRPSPAAAFQLTASDFSPGGTIPVRFTCSGENVSPALTWTQPPAGTRSLALIVDDPDAPAGTWVHWVVYDLLASLRRLPEGVPRTERLRDGGQQGSNDFRKTGYGGPCPPPGKPHRYFFHLYALDAPLSLPDRATRAEVDAAMRGHILAEARLMGRYGR
jgi:Raf kinase inhibitor-like YbhB/YbcL family protein